MRNTKRMTDLMQKDMLDIEGLWAGPACFDIWGIGLACGPRLDEYVDFRDLFFKA